MRERVLHILLIVSIALISFVPTSHSMEYAIFVEDNSYTLNEDTITNAQTQLGIKLNTPGLIGNTNYDSTNHVTYNLLKDELLNSDELLDFIGVFLSDYSNKNSFRFKIRIDDDYKLEKTVIYYKYNF